jgi:hypothetical protein
MLWDHHCFSGMLHTVAINLAVDSRPVFVSEVLHYCCMVCCWMRSAFAQCVCCGYRLCSILCDAHMRFVW